LADGEESTEGSSSRELGTVTGVLGPELFSSCPSCDLSEKENFIEAIAELIASMVKIAILESYWATWFRSSPKK
jgi:hypothetical protein